MTRVCPGLLVLAALRRARRHPWRTLLVMASTALGVAAMVGTFAVNSQVLGAFGEVRESLRSGAPLSVVAEPHGLSEDVLLRLREVEAVEAAVPVVMVVVPLRDQAASLQVLGVDLAAAGRILSSRQHQPSMTLDPASVAGPRPWVLLDRQGAARLGLTPGGTVAVRSPRGALTLKVAGLFDGGRAAVALGGHLAVAPVALAQNLKGEPGSFDRIDIFLREGRLEEEVFGDLAAAAGDGARVARAGVPLGGADQAFAHMHLGLMLAALTAVLAGAFLVHNVHAITLEERRPEVATVRALGGSRAQVVGPLVTEGLVLGTGGALLGVLLGWALAGMAVKSLRDNLPLVGLPGDPEVGLPEARLVLLALGVGVVSTLAAVFMLAWPVGREPAALSLRRRLEPRPRHLSTAAWGVAALFVLASAAVALLPLTGRDSGYVAIAALALAFGLLGPTLTSALLHSLLWISGRTFTWRQACHNLLRYPRRVGLTVAALGLASALGVQSSTVVSSFEARVLPWVKGAIPGDLFLFSGSSRLAAGRNQTLASEFLAEIRRLPGVRLARGARGLFLPFEEDFVYLVGIDMDAYEGAAGMEWHAGTPETAMPEVRAGEAVLVSDNFAGLHGVKLGDRIRLGGSKGPYELPVAGVVTDFSWGRGTLHVDRRLLEEKHGASTLDLVVISLVAPEEEAPVRAALQQRYGTTHDLVILSSSGFRRMVTDELAALFSFATAQQLVVLAIAFLAVLNTVTLSVMARRKEIGLLAAVGATPTQIRRSGALEGALLALVGVVLGLLLGVVIAVILLRDVLFQVSGWRFGVVLPWPVILAMGSGALLTGLLAGRLGTSRVLRDLSYQELGS